MTPATAYEVAVEFIRLGDIHRLFCSVGIKPDRAMDQEMTEHRTHLDSLLGEHDRTREFLAVVRKHNDLSAPPTVAGVLGGSS